MNLPLNYPFLSLVETIVAQWDELLHMPSFKNEIETVKTHSIKNLKEFRIMNLCYFRALELSYYFMGKIGPKVTKVGPKKIAIAYLKISCGICL